ncbi:hypothetical protein FRB94_001649 [Tulasnella sp. JGI-2019a]|nr:hypothetical protein FRB94_001649 [Tulasnella sp. JGI-2019a]KAG9010429.1 hypothetical protein FRB93_004269 [Tulasnella sp. JGI-2019a]KAG9038721.1 hypothetical protein FRB95_000311 [Tulasnella sp. JGI-2019a]
MIALTKALGLMAGNNTSSLVTGYASATARGTDAIRMLLVLSYTGLILSISTTFSAHLLMGDLSSYQRTRNPAQLIRHPGQAIARLDDTARRERHNEPLGSTASDRD